MLNALTTLTRTAEYIISSRKLFDPMIDITFFWRNNIDFILSKRYNELMKKSLVFATLFLVVFVETTFSSSIELDTSFSDNGLFSIPASQLDGEADPIAQTGLTKTLSGDLSVSGYTTSGTPVITFLAQITQLGVFNTGFGINGIVNLDLGNITRSLAIASFQNDTFLAGAFNDGVDIGGFVARYDASGDLMTSFNTSGTAFYLDEDVSFTSTLVDDDGSLFAFGYNSANETSFMVRYTVDGIMDTDIGVGGVVDLGAGKVRNTLLDADGKIVVVMEGDSSTAQVIIKRISQVGLLDNTFGIAGSTSIAFAAESSPVAPALAISPDGKIAIGGSRALTGLATRYGYIYVLTEDGSLDTEFNGDGSVLFVSGGGQYEVSALAYDEAGSLFVSGTLGGTVGDIYVYGPDGALDSSFDDSTISVENAAAGSVSLLYDDNTLFQAYAELGQENIHILKYTVTNDTDGDTIYDRNDNCIENANAGQEDSDADSIGDACEAPSVSSERRIVSGSRKKPLEEETLPVTKTKEVVPASTPETIFEFSRDLKKGMQGDDVMELQKILIQKNTGPASSALAKIGPTGYFGEYTRIALAELQTSLGISPTAGYFGPITRKTLKL